MKRYRIAIDGPSGAGKSTLARMLAKKYGLLYVDTGAIYRTVALAALRADIDPADAGAVEALLPRLDIRLDYGGTDGLQHMYLSGEDVTGDIRRREVSAGASKVSALPAVRAYLLEMQRELARTHSVVMDGRDIGTVVLPDAELKIYLTADAADRARRRCLELRQRGQDAPYEQVLREVEERDRRDTQRAAAPLRRASDAVLADTTGIGLEESAALLERIVEDRLGLSAGEAERA